MKPEEWSDLERRISRTRWPGPPEFWREEILAAAREASRNEARDGGVVGRDGMPWRAMGMASRWRRFAAWCWAPEPWKALAGALLVGAVMNQVGGWLGRIDETPPARTERREVAGSWAAARAHQARTLAWATVGEGDI